VEKGCPGLDARIYDLVGRTYRNANQAITLTGTPISLH